MSNRERIGILFVCMGNLCRSPLAESVFRHHANRRGVVRHFQIDSAGTGHWHVGEKPDRRVRAVAQANGVVLTGSARQIDRRDFDAFDYIICMDEDNLDNLRALNAPPEKVSLLMAFDPDAPMAEVPDPYYGGADGFSLVYKLVDRACAALLEVVMQQHGIVATRSTGVDST